MLSPQVGSVYRIRIWWRCFTVAYLALGLVFLGSTVTEAFLGTKVPTVRDIVVPVILSLVGLGICAHAFSSVVSFSENSVEVENVFRNRALPLAAIRGRREYVSFGMRHSTRYIVLVSGDDRFDSLKIARSYYTLDQRFWKWFNSLPDLDATERGTGFGLV